MEDIIKETILDIELPPEINLADVITEKTFLHYDVSTGKIIGFYSSALHGVNIPEPVVEITTEKHKFYMENNGKYRIDPDTLEDVLIVIEPDPVAAIKYELDTLDNVLPRCIEDLITSLGVPTNTLPQVMQDRLTRKLELRQQLTAITK